MSLRTASSSTDAAMFSALHALGNRTRLRIVEVLRRGEYCVCDLQANLGIAQSLLSHHLRVLRKAGLVEHRREGRWVHYALSLDSLEAAEDYLGSLRHDATWAPPRRSRC